MISSFSTTRFENGSRRRLDTQTHPLPKAPSSSYSSSATSPATPPPLLSSRLLTKPCRQRTTRLNIFYLERAPLSPTIDFPISANPQALHSIDPPALTHVPLRALFEDKKSKVHFAQILKSKVDFQDLQFSGFSQSKGRFFTRFSLARWGRHFAGAIPVRLKGLRWIFSDFPRKPFDFE